SLAEIDRIAQIFGVDHATFWQLYEKHRGAYDKNDIEGKEYWGRFASDTNTHLDDDTMEQLLRWDIEIWSNLEQPLLSWTRSLRVAGFQTALLSNLHLGFSAHMRSRSEWLRLFDYFSKLARGQIGNSGPKPLGGLPRLPAGNCSLSPIAGQVGRGRKTLRSA